MKPSKFKGYMSCGRQTKIEDLVDMIEGYKNPHEPGHPVFSGRFKITESSLELEVVSKGKKKKHWDIVEESI